MLPSSHQRELNGHEHMVHSLRKSSQLSNNICSHCKTNACLTPILASSTKPTPPSRRLSLVLQKQRLPHADPR
ncbi:hypothetical protein DPMN_097844 [Dreissena polymorpha]|uniref:Uncharacterized protein n=1 Tax=Dreissena polymorpha TaxID=45954 RepID=A0A9D4LCG2_DREPO|nr:hypothetical protein DPMN_097844 [Dreissena polymorpha]